MKSIIVPALALALLSANCGSAASNSGGTASGHGGIGAPTDVQGGAATVPRAVESTTAMAAGGHHDSQRERSEKQQGSYTEDESHSTAVEALKQELIGVAKLDGQSIVDIQLRSRCQTMIVTPGGQTLIDWSGVGNFARNVDNGVATIPIDDGHGEHDIRLPEGVGSQRVDGGFGLLADECSPK